MLSTTMSVLLIFRNNNVKSKIQETFCITENTILHFRLLAELGFFVESSLWNQWGNHRAACVHSVAPAVSNV